MRTSRREGLSPPSPMQYDAQEPDACDRQGQERDESGIVSRECQRIAIEGTQEAQRRRAIL